MHLPHPSLEQAYFLKSASSKNCLRKLSLSLRLTALPVKRTRNQVSRPWDARFSASKDRFMRLVGVSYRNANNKLSPGSMVLPLHDGVAIERRNQTLLCHAKAMNSNH